MRAFPIFLFFLTGCGDNSLSPIKTKTKGKRDFTMLTRVGSTMYSVGDTAGASGLDYDLVTRLTPELGIKH